MKHEIKYISPMSVIFSVVPVILLALGFLGALIAFVIFPESAMKSASAIEKIASVATFTLIYAISIQALIVICVFIYNLFCSGLGFRGVRVEFEPVEEGEELEVESEPQEQKEEISTDE